uniref:[histone H3]-lysine(27) N-trimethyltransferase n=1 Tax=Ditylenchus dipsaci TaxID=166011 RepID=A0A915D781_9BILA
MKVMKKKLRSSRKISLRESVSLNNKMYASSPSRSTRQSTQAASCSSTPTAKAWDRPKCSLESLSSPKKGRRLIEPVGKATISELKCSPEKLRSSDRKRVVSADAKQPDEKEALPGPSTAKIEPKRKPGRPIAKPNGLAKARKMKQESMEESIEKFIEEEKLENMESEGENAASSASSTTSNEENMELQLEDEWIELLMNEYWRVRHCFEETVNTQGMAAFEKSRCKPTRHTLHTGKAPPPFDLFESVGRNQQLAFLRNENNSVAQKCSVIPLENIEATPPMQYWTLTEVNVIAEDEFTLSHIPFLGDTEDDSEFCSELMKTFPDGIHGTKEGCKQYINDWILYYTVKAVRDALPNLELKTIFHCIYEKFPNKAAVQDLITMYPDLQIRFEPETIDRQELTDRKGELVANFSSSRLLNSYEVLVCHKCFCYDCTMHNATIQDGYGSTMRKFSRPKENDNRPCSDDCYILLFNLAKRDQKSKSNGLHSDKDLNKQLNIQCSDQHKTPLKHEQPPVTEWTPHEESIFNILRTTGEENYCKITQVLNMCSEKKKSCRELYDYACRTAPMSPRLELVQSPVKTAKKKGDSHRTFRAVKWANTNGKVENNCMYKPCNHKGECKKELGCRCVIVENLCTKYCPCSDDCQNRFPGCRCAPGNCRTRQCQCFFASWECDPDICKSCNCDKFDGCGEPICKNVSIQRGLQKRLLEDIEKNDFVSEYCGEVITQAESERRGKIYDKIKCSYLFGLNDEQVVDATRVGNVIRFANHSRNPNCRAKVIVVNGDHKIGIFANRHINRGEELFFDYAYNKSQQIAFLSKELSKNQC